MKMRFMIAVVMLMLSGAAAAQEMKIGSAVFRLGMTKLEAAGVAGRAGLETVEGSGVLALVSGPSGAYAQVFFDKQDRARAISRDVGTFTATATDNLMNTFRSIYAVLERTEKETGTKPIVSIHTIRIPNAMTREIFEYHLVARGTSKSLATTAMEQPPVRVS